MQDGTKLLFMKADINYLYILFAIVYVIYSIIKAGKKASKNRPTITKQPSSNPADQQPPQSPRQEKTPGEDFKKMLEELLGGTPEEQVPEKHPDTYQEPQKVIPEKPRPVKVFTPLPKKEKKAVYKPKFTTAESKISSETPHFISHPEIVQSSPVQIVLEEKTSDKYDFDIRQAIIYSEILKRPQY